MWGFSEIIHTVPECSPALKEPLWLSVLKTLHTVPEHSPTSKKPLWLSVGECGGFSIKPPHSPTFSKMTILPLKHILKTWVSVGVLVGPLDDSCTLKSFKPQRTWTCTPGSVCWRRRASLLTYFLQLILLKMYPHSSHPPWTMVYFSSKKCKTPHYARRRVSPYINIHARKGVSKYPRTFEHPVVLQVL